MKRPESTTSPRRAFSSGIRSAHWAFTSMWGISVTVCHSGGAAPPGPPPEPGDAQEDEHDAAVVRVPEAVVEALVALADRPADAGEGEAPDRGAGESQE